MGIHQPFLRLEKIGRKFGKLELGKTGISSENCENCAKLKAPTRGFLTKMTKMVEISGAERGVFFEKKKSRVENSPRHGFF